MADENEGGGSDLQAQIQAAVDEAVKGLKATNAALKDEKTALKTRLDEIGGQLEALGGADGVKHLVELRENLSKNEETKLLAEGKHEEWFERRTAAMKRDAEKQIEALTAQIAERDTKINDAHGKLRAHVLRTELTTACDVAGIKEAGPKRDALFVAEREFQFDPERDGFVLKDQDGSIVYGKDGKSPKTMADWLQEKKEVAEFRHWWPGSTPAGANGSDFRGMEPDRKIEAMSKMPMDEYRKARAGA